MPLCLRGSRMEPRRHRDTEEHGGVNFNMELKRKIGIMSAMQEEILGVEELIEGLKIESVGVHTYYSGTINGHCVTLVFSGWGKVAAASTVSTLIHRFQVTEVLFTGVAGALDPSLKIGDIVLGKRLIQHDMDARPIFQQFEIPLLNQTFISANEGALTLMAEGIQEILTSKSLTSLLEEEALIKFNLHEPLLIIGDIASGDQFINNNEQRNEIISALPSVVCVEMEGAAVAQVCYENGIPFIIIRTISDVADENSHIDFLSFVKEVSSKYSIEIVRKLLM